MSRAKTPPKRHGPQPLALHLGLAAPLMRAQDGVEIWRKMLMGLRRYQTHRFFRKPVARPCVWRAGCVRMYAARVPDPSDRPPILLVPSLINGSSILDLLPQKSLMQFLSDSGWPVYLLDWGDIRHDPSYQTLDDAIVSGLVPALEFLQARHGQSPSAIGYCMGGTMLVAAAQLLQGQIGPCVYLATPWDFQAQGGGLYPLVQIQAFQIRANLTIADFVPAEFLQSLFAAVDPSMSARKFSAFSRVKRGSMAEKLFIAVEDWVNDGRDLPTPIARTAFEAWYLGNTPAQGRWQVAGQQISLDQIMSPALIISPRRDRLVPPDSVAPLSDMSNAQILKPDCGHLGVVVGADCETKLWRKIDDWLQRKTAAPQQRARLDKKRGAP